MGQRNEYEPADPGIVFPGISHDGVPAALAAKYQLRNLQELEHTLELLAGLAITEFSKQPHGSDPSDRRRTLRTTAKGMKKDAGIALVALKRMRLAAKEFKDAAGSPSPSGSMLRAVFKNVPINSVDAPEEYYALAGFDVRSVDQLDALMERLEYISDMVLSKEKISGVMANEQLRTALQVCFDYVTRVEGKKWGNAGLRQKDVRKFNIKSGLRSEGEKIVTDLLSISGIPFDYEKINSMWLETQRAGRRAQRSLPNA